jgi:hypothetical protein
MVTVDNSGTETARSTDNGGIYGWLDGAYHVGSTDLWSGSRPSLALSFAAIFLGNGSQNGTSIPQDPFPPLPQPQRNYVWNAQKAILSLLAKPSCWQTSQIIIFNKFRDFHKIQITSGTFSSYLSTRPGFYDGTRSSLPYRDAVCGEGGSWWRQFNCGTTPGSVAFFWEDGQTAETVTPSSPLKMFWQPTFTRSQDNVPAGCGTDPGDLPCDGTWPGTGIDPDNNGANLTTMSTLFHESLHGITGLEDADIQKALGIPQVGDTRNISLWILNHVLSVCTNNP